MNRTELSQRLSYLIPIDLAGGHRSLKSLMLACLLSCLAFPIRTQPFADLQFASSYFDGSYVSIRSGIQASDGFIWFTTNEGLVRFDGYNYVVFTPIPGDSLSIGTKQLTKLAEVNDSLIAVGTGGGRIEIFNTNTCSVYRRIELFDDADRYVAPIHSVRGIYVDENETIWTASQLGLRKIDPHNGSLRQYKVFPQDGQIQSWTRDRNLLWEIQPDYTRPNSLLISGQYGLFRFDPVTEQFDIVDTTYYPINYTIQDTLHDQIYMSCWGDGLVNLDLNTGITRKLADELNLNGTMVFNQVSDSTIFTLHKKYGFGVLDLKTKSLTFSDDPEINPWLVDNYVMIGDKGFMDNNGGLWLFGDYKFWKFYFPAKDKHPPIRLALTNITDSRSTHTCFSEDVFELPSNDRSIQVAFAAINRREPDKYRYAYRLDSNSWKDLGKNRQISFDNLSHGLHTLHVRVTDPAGDNSAEAELLEFQVTLPPWERAWVRLVSILLLLAIIIFIAYQRNKSIRAEARLKEYERQMAELELKALRSQMNPHFMFNSLNSIKNYILQAEPKIAAEYLSNFSHLIRMILQNSGAKLITLKEELETLLLYVDLEKLRFDEDFEFNCIIDEGIDQNAVQIPPMILQPYVENAIWHGLMHRKSKGQLTIEVKKSQNAIKCIIEDNGVGREAAARLKDKSIRKYRSMGMGITKDRIDIINRMNALGISTLVEDLKDEDGTARGTRVTICIPSGIDDNFN